MLLGRNTWIGARDVHETEQRKPVQLRELHQPHCLAIALRIGHAEVTVGSFLDVAALLVAHERDRATVEATETDHERMIVGPAAVTVQLDPIVEEPADVVQRVRAVLVARKLDRAPALLARRRGLDARELALELLELARDLRAPEQAQIAQTGEPLAQSQLGVSRHSRRRAAGAVRRTPSIPAAERLRRCGRSAGFARQDRSPRAASLAWSAARHEGPCRQRELRALRRTRSQA